MEIAEHRETSSISKGSADFEIVVSDSFWYNHFLWVWGAGLKDIAFFRSEKQRTMQENYEYEMK